MLDILSRYRYLGYPEQGYKEAWIISDNPRFSAYQCSRSRVVVLCSFDAGYDVELCRIFHKVFNAGISAGA